MGDAGVNNGKRRFLLVASSVAGGAAAVAVAVPFLWSMQPSARARAAGAPVEVDISKVEPGMMIRAEWRSKPVWIVRRTPEMIEALKRMDSKVADPESQRPMQPQYAQNEYRSIKPEWLVLVGICTHLGCSPTDQLKAGPDSGLGEDWADSSVPATAPSSTLPGAYSRTCPLPPTSRCRSTSS
jgi:ubiquinol-cytochrome c reductase iron-sulfur subunit